MERFFIVLYSAIAGPVSLFSKTKLMISIKKAEVEPNNKQIICEIQNTRLRLQKIMQYKTKGAILRSKVRWHESGERNTRYFYNLEKRSYDKKTITKLKRSNGTFINNQFEILQEQMDFYKTLYTSEVHPENVINLASTFFENITPLPR